MYTIQIDQETSVCHLKHFPCYSCVEFTSSHLHYTYKCHSHSSKTSISVFRSDAIASAGHQILLLLSLLTIPYAQKIHSTPGPKQSPTLPICHKPDILKFPATSSFVQEPLGCLFLRLGGSGLRHRRLCVLVLALLLTRSLWLWAAIFTVVHKAIE